MRKRRLKTLRINPELKEKMKRSAVMIDTKILQYVCPNNRNGESATAASGHFFRVSTSEKLNGKRRPICPYCKTKTKMIEFKGDEDDNSR